MLVRVHAAGVNPYETYMRAFTLWGITPAEEKGIHAGLGAGLRNGTLRPVVGREFQLREAALAHKAIMEARGRGENSPAPVGRAGENLFYKFRRRA